MSLVNTVAPDFTLNDQNGTAHTLAEYQGNFVLLYFYPKDMTPGCTIEAKGFQTMLGQLNDAGIQILGVSADSCESHKRFAQRHQLHFTLLADVNHEVVKEYGVFSEKKMFGKSFFGINRQSFLINPDGVVVKHYEKVNPKDHPQEVLRDIASFQKPSATTA